MICKQSSNGIGFSLVELSGVRHIFAAAAPRHGGSLAEQTRDALRTIEQVIHQEGTRGSIVHQAVFLRNKAQSDECRRLIREFYGDELPATTYIAQPPCDGKLVAIEALGVGSGHDGVEIQRYGEQLVIARHSGVSWIHCSQIVPQIPDGGVFDRASSALESMRRLLGSAGARFEDVVRTWLYLGDIVGPDGFTQRYKELNRARTEFYRDIHFGHGRTHTAFDGRIYPASTGIGTSNGDVVISAIAMLSERDDVLLLPLENPNQVAACDYATRYGPNSPKFVRAMAVASGGCATIFISGTASITDSESRYLRDVEGQTHQTLDNIEALISEANFQRYERPGLGATLDDLALVRVYVKRPEDYLNVRAVCQARLGDVPAIYAVADVCRPELLVEIEGIAFSHHGGV
jgi:enamine deaminase RidA (YjgF/YER057c/UK114 family)